MDKKPEITTKRCCYGSCTSDSRRDPNNTLRFIPFPEACLRFNQDVGSVEQHLNHCDACERVARWTKSCGNASLKSIRDVTGDSYVCSLHFVGANGPSERFPDPVSLIGPNTSCAGNNPFEAVIKEEIDVDCCDFQQTPQEYNDCNWIKKEEPADSALPGGSAQNDVKNAQLASTPMDLFEELLKSNERACYFYTGLHFDQIQNVLKFLGSGPCTDGANGAELTALQQLLLVLMRLRRGFLVQDLAFRFDVEVEVVARLIKTWIHFMHSEFGEKLGAEMPQNVDVDALGDFCFLKEVSSSNSGGSMAPFVLVCACLQKFQSSASSD